ncbi:MAG: DNA polymerase [Pyrinomonadaceae bacterium]
MIETPYQVITTSEDLRAAIEKLSKEAVVGFDTETTSLDPYDGRIRLVQLAAPGFIFIFDLDKLAPNGDAAGAENLQPLRNLLSAPRPVKVAHHAKFDVKWMKHFLGVEVCGLFDTLLASQLIAAGNQEERHSLDAVAARFLDETVDKTEQRSDWGGELSDSQLAYAARDAAIMLPLRENMIERLKRDELVRCAALEFDCVPATADIELAGVFLDVNLWREQMKNVELLRARLAQELQSMLSEGTVQGSLFVDARADVNIDSHTQLTAALKRLNVPVPDSTRNWKLQPLAADYPVVAKLLEYRTVQKSLTSYGQNIIDEINPHTNRIHANFHQIGAPTGRYACTNPNVQQVPHSIEYRRCFRAPEGRKLVISDYSQIELRILAEFTGDEGFINAFNSGADLHRTTAAQVFSVALEEVTSEQRSFAKRLNFGVVYGIGAQRFSMMTGLPLSDSEEIMRRYFATYHKLDAWLRDAARRAVRERTARTASGRLARFNFDPEDRKSMSLAQRNGKNTPIQGSSADILKRALRLLRDELKGTSARIINIVHDETVVEADASEAEEISGRVKRAMCAAGEEYVKSVPVEVESHVADAWVK